MEIKTKFNIGDTVYATCKGTYIKGKIHMISVYIDSDMRISTSYDINIGRIWEGIWESNVYATKEELMNVIFDNLD